MLSYNLTNSIISAGSIQSGFADDLKSLQTLIFEDVNEVKTDGLTFLIDETFIKHSNYFNPVHSKNLKLLLIIFLKIHNYLVYIYKQYK